MFPLLKQVQRTISTYYPFRSLCFRCSSQKVLVKTTSHMPQPPNTYLHLTGTFELYDSFSLVRISLSLYLFHRLDSTPRFWPHCTIPLVHTCFCVLNCSQFTVKMCCTHFQQKFAKVNTCHMKAWSYEESTEHTIRYAVSDIQSSTRSTEWLVL